MIKKFFYWGKNTFLAISVNISLFKHYCGKSPLKQGLRLAFIPAVV